MGQEIDSKRFTHKDFETSAVRLAEETALFERWVQEGRFAAAGGVGGFELEAWLIDASGSPLPINETYIERVDDPLVVAELARFNVEFNVEPRMLRGAALGQLHRDMQEIWARCDKVAAEFDSALMMIGILPTVTDRELTLKNMSRLRRYRLLNEQVLKARLGKPLRLDIVGREHLQTTHKDVMLESAATSFQIHLQVPANEAKRYYNAALIASAPMVAMSANSPFLFGRDLWDETRIPLFEQSVEVGGYDGAAQGPIRRVTFGSGYVRESIVECFAENLAHYPVLLPKLFDEPPEKLAHLRLHNGTIWRWNRPLVGFDDQGHPHLRIEHRVVPAGPTVGDCIANAAVFFGLATSLAGQEVPPESQIPFSEARDNFYAAARLGLGAQVSWLEGKKVAMQSLLLEQILPLARAGLHALGVDGAEAAHYVDVLAQRVRSGRHGAAWQREFTEAHGRDMAALTLAYLTRQRAGRPVAEWDI